MKFKMPKRIKWFELTSSGYLRLNIHPMQHSVHKRADNNLGRDPVAISGEDTADCCELDWNTASTRWFGVQVGLKHHVCYNKAPYLGAKWVKTQYRLLTQKFELIGGGQCYICSSFFTQLSDVGLFRSRMTQQSRSSCVMLLGITWPTNPSTRYILS